MAVRPRTEGSTAVTLTIRKRNYIPIVKVYAAIVGVILKLDRTVDKLSSGWVSERSLDGADFVPISHVVKHCMTQIG